MMGGGAHQEDLNRQSSPTSDAPESLDFSDLENFCEELPHTAQMMRQSSDSHERTERACSANKNTKASIKIATLNIRGYRQAGVPTTDQMAPYKSTNER